MRTCWRSGVRALDTCLYRGSLPCMQQVSELTVMKLGGMAVYCVEWLLDRFVGSDHFQVPKCMVNPSREISLVATSRCED